jgi:hypothetical protein
MYMPTGMLSPGSYSHQDAFKTCKIPAKYIMRDSVEKCLNVSGVLGNPYIGFR